MSDLDHEEQELLAKLAEIRRKKEEAKKSCVISSPKIAFDKLYFKVTGGEDFLNWLKSYPEVFEFDKKLHIEMHYWKELHDAMLNLDNPPTFEFTDEQWKQINEWIPTPDYYVGKDEKNLYVKIGPKAKHNLITDIPTAQWQGNISAYRITNVEGWRIAAALYNTEGINVEWDDTAKAYCIEQLERRKSLDTIAKQEVSEVIVDLNGQELKPFQSVSLPFAAAAGFNLIIGDEMGLGKTPQAIAITRYFNQFEQVKGKHLIVVPASLRVNWVREIGKFTGVTPYQLLGSVPSKTDIVEVIKGTNDYYLINYDLLSVGYTEKVEEVKKDLWGNDITSIKEVTHYPWIDVLNLADFHTVTIDECHKVKNLDSKRSQAILRLKVPHKILLSGTPLINRPGELWPLIHMLDPNLVGGYDSFLNRYTYQNGKFPKNVNELREILKPIMLRRTKAEVQKDLPPINRIERFTELSNKAADAYRKVLMGVYEALDKYPADPTAVNNILVEMMRLKQICAWDKVDYIADLATELYDGDEGEHRKVIIFTQFVNDPPVLTELRKKLGNEALSISGSDNVNDRQAVVDRFQNDPNIHFIVCSTAAASEGLTMTAAGHIIFADLMWTPAAHAQAEGRAYGRLNDAHGISSYYILKEGTIETEIMGLLQSKMNVAAEVVDGAMMSRDESVFTELLNKMKGR